MKGNPVPARQDDGPTRRSAFDVFEYGIYKRHGYADATDDHTRWGRRPPHRIPQHTAAVRRRLRPAPGGAAMRAPARRSVSRSTTPTRATGASGTTRGRTGAPPSETMRSPFVVTPLSMLDERGQPEWHKIDYTMPQDFAAWWTQGPIADRSQEVPRPLGQGHHPLPAHARGKSSESRRTAADPLNTFRDPAQNVYLGMRTEDNRVAV